MSKTKISVLVDDENLHRLNDVVKQVKGVGMDVDHVLESSGVVTGSVDANKLKILKKVKGVSSIEEEREFQIAPPESKVQ
jgi:hypothetical protein